MQQTFSERPEEFAVTDVGGGFSRIEYRDSIGQSGGRWVADVVATYVEGTVEEAARAAPAMRDRVVYEAVPEGERVRQAVETLARIQAEALPDEDAVAVAALFPAWGGGGRTYAEGERLNHLGTLYRVLQDHVSQPGWEPGKAPSLFAEVLCAPGEEPKPFRVVPGGEGYMTGETCTDGGRTWRSRIDHNVWAPSTSPQFWERLD